MNLELFTSAEPRGTRADSPRSQSGAYEALMARGGQLSQITRALRRHPGLRLADLAPAAQIDAYAQLTTQIIHAAGIGAMGVAAWGSAQFPARLRQVDVALLYHQGSWDLVGTRCVAVVGTRRPSAAGLARTAQLVRQLVGDGFTIVSGLARGVDACAHQAALEAGGRTIAVLGTPLSECYPPENQSLQQRIATGQLLISHVPFVLHAQQAVHANREFFLHRNAIIAALSDALIVVEAGERSGAVVAARHALRQGRKLLIPHPCFHDGSLQWPGRLAAQGGICVSNLQDIRDQTIAGPASPAQP